MLCIVHILNPENAKDRVDCAKVERVRSNYLRLLYSYLRSNFGEEAKDKFVWAMGLPNLAKELLLIHRHVLPV